MHLSFFLAHCTVCFPELRISRSLPPSLSPAHRSGFGPLVEHFSMPLLLVAPAPLRMRGGMTGRIALHALDRARIAARGVVDAHGIARITRSRATDRADRIRAVAFARWAATWAGAPWGARVSTAEGMRVVDLSTQTLEEFTGAHTGAIVRAASARKAGAVRLRRAWNSCTPCTICRHARPGEEGPVEGARDHCCHGRNGSRRAQQQRCRHKLQQAHARATGLQSASETVNFHW